MECFCWSIEPGYLTAFVLLIIFFLERLVNYRLNKSLTQKDWFVEVIVKSNLDSVHNFYSEVEEIYESYHQNFYSFDVGQSEDLLDKFKNCKEKFEFNFIFLVRSFSAKKGNELTQCINKLDDIIVQRLTSEENLSQNEKDEEIRRIHENKEEFFSKLYKKVDELNY